MIRRFKITWPTAAVAMVAIAAGACVVLFGQRLGMDPETHAEWSAAALAGAVGLVAFLRPLITRDADGDGAPALTDADDNDPGVQ